MKQHLVETLASLLIMTLASADLRECICSACCFEIIPEKSLEREVQFCSVGPSTTSLPLQRFADTLARLLPTVTSSSLISLAESSMKPSSNSLLNLLVEMPSSRTRPMAALIAFVSPASLTPSLPLLPLVSPFMSNPIILSPLSSSNSPPSSLTTLSLRADWLLLVHVGSTVPNRFPILSRIDCARNASGIYSPKIDVVDCNVEFKGAY